jgi:glycerol uptake facilitator-like aquaporin
LAQFLVCISTRQFRLHSYSLSECGLRIFFAYIVAQALGSIAAAYAIRLIFTQAIAGQFRNGVTSLAPGVSFVLGFVI